MTLFEWYFSRKGNYISPLVTSNLFAFGKKYTQEVEIRSNSSEMENDRGSFRGTHKYVYVCVRVPIGHRARRIDYTRVHRQSIQTIMNTCWPSRTRATETAAESARGKCRTDAKLLPESHSRIPVHVRVAFACAKGRERKYRKRYLPKGNN